MNKLHLLFCTTALIMTSCTLSNEEKAVLLVEKTVKSSLEYPDSYEAISIRMDSMFIDATAIEPILVISEEIKHFISCVNRCERDIDLIELEIETLGEFCDNDEIFSKKEKATYDLEKYNRELSRTLDALKANVNKYCIGTFTGWIVSHRYNALNQYGITPIIPHEYKFFCNKEITSCWGMSVWKYVDFQTILDIIDKSKTDNDIIKNFKAEFFISPYQSY
ncbi:MAG: hypothetical protein E7081_07055 [Bacteroidales bacterium]|nr:hypothetical protein [Bacteroidales bacterium]